MSFEFHVEEYCDDCPEFEVGVKEHLGPEDFNLKRKTEYYISCKHSKRCENMMKFLKKKLEKENTNEKK